MAKRVLIVITVLLMAGLAAGWYFFAKESKFLGTSPLKAVPVNAPFFIRIGNLGAFAEKSAENSFWQTTKNFGKISELHSELVFIDSLMLRSKKFEKILRHKELFVVPLEDSRLYLLKIGSITEKNSINAFIRDYFLSQSIVAKVEEYKDASLQLYETVKDNESGRIYVTFYRGILMFSKEASNLILAIDQMDQTSLLEDPDYLRINKNSAQNTDLNIFINHKRLPEFLSRFSTDSLTRGILLPNYARWTEIDVLQKDSQLLVNGFSFTDSTLACYLDVFRRQGPLAGSIIRSMPSVTTFFMAQNLSRTAQYFEDYLSYLSKNGKIEVYNREISSVSKELNLNVSQYLTDHWTGEAATVYTNHNLADSTDNRFFLMKVVSNGNDPLVIAIKKWSADKKMNQQNDEISDSDRDIIWRVPTDHFGKLISDFCFGPLETKWMTAGDGFILMGATPGSLKRYMNFLKSGELLQENPSYARSSSGLARSSSFYMWCAPGKSLPFFESMVKPAHYQSLSKSVNNLKKLENFSWQWGYENGVVFNTASLIVNPDVNQNETPFWRYPLKAKMRDNPVFVSYSKSSNLKDVVFQDLDNNLIDIDKDGTERWRIRLDGPILGRIKVIESNKKGEYHLLFNTRRALHRLDRKGDEARNFPVRFKSNATNEVAVFDYDGKNDYRYVVACSDRKIYNFDKNGKITSGWQPKAVQGVVEFPARHYRIGSRDYIVLADRFHTYILDRQGKERVKIRDEFVRSRNDISLITTKEGARWMASTDDRGKIRLLGFDGSAKKITAGNFSTDHFFLPVDFTGDGNINFLFVDRQKLSLYDFAGKIIYSNDLNVSIDKMPALLNLGNEKLVELSSVSENQSILIKKDGSIFD
ncbi:MAG TPA: hypothetical protein VN249_12305, partial [Prolixibacteraceae bacterium]|nr:hypothetical protein [Prolixibacteraceae bacterium]